MRGGCRWLFQQLFPPACPLCKKTFPAGWAEPFCGSCSAGFLVLPSARCSCCALPFAAADSSSHLCGRCLQSPPGFSRVHVLGRYEKSLRDAIHQFKFNNQVSLDKPLGQLLADVIPEDEHFDQIVPVPLSSRRLRQRSYNQALLLARELGKRLRVPVANGLLVKTVETVPQHDLSASERQRNLRGVIYAKQRCSGEKILLLDDVMTTGSTLRACSEELKRSGAGQIDVAVLGRA